MGSVVLASLKAAVKDIAVIRIHEYEDNEQLSHFVYQITGQWEHIRCLPPSYLLVTDWALVATKNESFRRRGASSSPSSVRVRRERSIDGAA